MSAAKNVPLLRFKDFEAGWGCERLGDSFSLREERNSDGRETEILSVVKDVGVILYSEKGNLGNRAKDDVTQYNIARKGDIVLNSMNVIIGSVGVSRYDGCISPAYYALRPLDKTDSKFWGCWFWRSKTQGLISSRACGMMEIRRKISTSDLLELEVYAPEKAEQTKIGEIINSLEQIIESRSVSYEKLRSLKKAMLEKMFPRASAKVPEVRFKGFEGVWRKVRLDNVCTMFSGGTPTSTNHTFYGGDVNWVSISDMTKSGKYITETEKQLTQEGFENCSAKMFPPSTLLFAMYASIGKCCIAPESVCSSQAILGLYNLDGVDVEFLYYDLSRREKAFAKMGQTGSQANLSKAIVSEIKVNMPPTFAEQLKIGAYFRSLDALISARQEEVGKLKDLKKALLDRMFV